ncbi:MAG: VWA domain-containing protein [Myxococcales bacterium]|nr:MAG: VWA domain-containing protein [Myxococcales bacterium]
MATLLEWEEQFFLGLKALYKRVVQSPQDRRRALVSAALAPQRQQLFLLAHMIANRSVLIIETPQAVLCDEAHLFLPPEFSVASTKQANEALFRVKTVLGALAIRSSDRGFCGAPLEERVAAWSEEFSSLGEWIALVQRELGDMSLWQILGEFRQQSQPEAESAIKEKPPPSAEEAQHELTEIEGQGQIDTEVQVHQDEQPMQAEMPIHTFEKVEALEEYMGVPRKTDDEDELEDHAEALKTLNMKQLLRSQERPHSIYRADLVMNGPELELQDDTVGEGIPYPEWDYKKKRHKANWCFVKRTQFLGSDPAWAEAMKRKHKTTIFELRKKMASLATQTQRIKRQPMGPELDIDAVVTAQIDLRTGFPVDDRFYVERQRKVHDVAAMVLMDQSYSTDAWLSDARVLDTITETLFCLGEVLDDLVADFCVAGFSSQTRRQCDFWLIKQFAESWPTARARLGAIDACGYTRIGPALRHAQNLLLQRPAERRVIFLLTDGRPCDYDRYEGEYGIQDVRKAIQSGAEHGIYTHAFAIEKRAREQFPRMFERHEYDIVSSPRALISSMCRVFARLRFQY